MTSLRSSYQGVFSVGSRWKTIGFRVALESSKSAQEGALDGTNRFPKQAR
jgi:hypothetical protein